MGRSNVRAARPLLLRSPCTVASTMSTPPDTETVRARLRALLPDLRARYAVRSLAIFGSYARGEQTPESDLDVLVEFDRAPDLYAFVELGLDLEEALGLTVDIGTQENLKPRALPTVLHDLVPV